MLYGVMNIAVMNQLGSGKYIRLVSSFEIRVAEFDFNILMF